MSRNMKKRLGGIFATFALIATLFSFTSSSGAFATGSDEEDCEPYWQRYSWTGGPREEDSPPTEVPPHENWQPNVKGDPHDVGQAGPYYRSNGNSGMGDWFYLEWVEPDCPVDECPNIDGDQVEVPEGYELNDKGECVPVTPPPTDVCPNIEGDQSELPEGYEFNETGECVPVTPPGDDVCPNIDGDQVEVPEGYVLNEAGECVPVTPPGDPEDPEEPNTPNEPNEPNAPNPPAGPSGNTPFDPTLLLGLGLLGAAGAAGGAAIYRRRLAA